jgi:hypothetical protein
MMNITHQQLQKAVKANLITADQAEALVTFFKITKEPKEKYDLTHALYYLGGFVAIGAMTLFMNIGWERFGGAGLVGLSLLYALLGLGLSSICHRKHLATPAAICATFVVCLTPLAVYGLQVWMGWWPSETLVYRNVHYSVQWHWIFMELGTLITGCLMIYIYRYPLLMLPIAVTLWYMSMDLSSMLSGGAFNYNLSAQVSLYMGLSMVLLALVIDVRSRYTADYAFWLYLFGGIAFWFGLSSLCSDTELQRFFYGMANVLLIFIGTVLVRRIFVVLGMLGVAGYLGYLSWTVFKYSLMFPLMLTIIGFGMIYLGVLWQQNQARLVKQIRRKLPRAIRACLAISE